MPLCVSSQPSHTIPLKSIQGIGRSRSHQAIRKAKKAHPASAPRSGRVNSEGEQLRFPPSDGRLHSIEAPCLPFSGEPSTPALRPRGHTPLEPPTDLSPHGKPRGMGQISHLPQRNGANPKRRDQKGENWKSLNRGFCQKNAGKKKRRADDLCPRIKEMNRRITEAVLT
jgi:hypothetical protein